MIRLTLLVAVLLLSVPSANAQQAKVLRQHDMGRWGIPAGNYSGIAPLRNGRYALISDKQPADGWTEVSIDFSDKGDIRSMTFVGHHYATNAVAGAAPKQTARDAEGIVATNEGTLFVSAENDQRIVELDSLGQSTGRELAVPESFSVQNIYGNYGFEALAYNPSNGHFWTTTEQPQRSDSEAPTNIAHPVSTKHRILEFGADLQPFAQYPYNTEVPTIAQEKNTLDNRPATYAYGIPEMTVLNDTTLLVLEREAVVRRGYNGSYVNCNLFRYHPSATLDNSAATSKQFVTSFRTVLRFLGRKDFANYEGMCLGPVLPDGRRTVLLVADSQNRQGNRLFHLKDYIRVIVLDD